jgi:hypothetical protein
MDIYTAYNNKIAIYNDYLYFGLDGLHSLIKDRSDGNIRGQILEEFVILGKFYMGSRGEFSRLTFNKEAEYIPTNLAKVVPANSLRDMVKVSLTIEGLYDYEIPTSKDKCDECGFGWTLDNCDDVVVIGRDSNFTYKHKYCNTLAVEREQMEFYKSVLDEVGLDKALLTAIPNEYWGDSGGPWCLIRTPFGNIKLGPRKRVYALSWEDVLEVALKPYKNKYDNASQDRREEIKDSLDSDIMFPDENVTKGGTGIHAWGKDKLVEYLDALTKVMKVGKYKP